MTGGLIDNDQGGFRAGMRYVDPTLTLKQIDKKTREKKRRVYVGFIGLVIGLIGKLCGKC